MICRYAPSCGSVAADTPDEFTPKKIVRTSAMETARRRIFELFGIVRAFSVGRTSAFLLDAGLNRPIAKSYSAPGVRTPFYSFARLSRRLRQNRWSKTKFIADQRKARTIP